MSVPVPGASMIPELLDFAGVAVFAISGALAGSRKGLDLLGIVVIASVTAIGGGTIRDLLLGRDIFWILRPSYLYVIIGATLLTIAYTRWFHPPDRLLLYADALGLAMFTISGAQIAEAIGHAGVVVVLMGTLTGVAGGMLRDVLCAEIPMILRKGQIYATACIAGATAYLLLQAVAPPDVAALSGMFAIALLRIAAILFDLSLPVFHLHHHERPGRD